MLKGLDEMHKDNFGWTPLHEAAYLGSTLIVDMLLQYGSDINDVDNEGKNALYFACQEGHLGVVKLLIMRNASFDHQSHDGNTPFRYLYFFFKVEIKLTDSFKLKQNCVFAES
jgi:ankyrin repeat protein